MSKPYTEADFSDLISLDRGWRIKEISDLKLGVLRSDNSLQKVMLRALIAICYAHWEGSVKYAAQRYLQHISLRKVMYSDLSRQFIKNHFLPRLNALSVNRVSMNEKCMLIDEILEVGGKRYSRVNPDLVDTGSNLNSSVFQNICTICGVSASDFQDRSIFIDTFLLKRRNEIAHGEGTYVDISDLDELTNDTISLMRRFGDALENNVYTQSYRISAR